MSAETSNKPHILPLSVYFGVAAVLLVMTFVTVWAASFDFGEYNVIIAMVIAVFKASLVALIFMHLFWDNKIYSVAFVSSLVFLGFFLTLTMYDTLNRGDIYTERDRPIVPAAVIYESLEPAAGESETIVEDSLSQDEFEDESDSTDTSAEDEDWGFE